MVDEKKRRIFRSGWHTNELALSILERIYRGGSSRKYDVVVLGYTKLRLTFCLVLVRFVADAWVYILDLSHAAGGQTI